MSGEIEDIAIRGDGDEALGAAMINVAMALMREVKTDLGKMSDKLDRIADERRKEAWEHGGLEARVSTLETAHKTTRGIATTVAAAIILLAIGFLFRLAVLHPETVAK